MGVKKLSWRHLGGYPVEDSAGKRVGLPRGVLWEAVVVAVIALVLLIAFLLTLFFFYEDLIAKAAMFLSSAVMSLVMLSGLAFPLGATIGASAGIALLVWVGINS